GTLDASKVRDMATRLFNARDVHDYYICGPEQLVADVTRELAALGVDPARVRRAEVSGDSAPPPREATQASAPASAAPSANETRVEFVMDGRRRSFTMRTDFETILDAAARAGIELPFSCKAGVCSTCRTKLVRGK